MAKDLELQLQHQSFQGAFKAEYSAFPQKKSGASTVFSLSCAKCHVTWLLGSRGDDSTGLWRPWVVAEVTWSHHLVCSGLGCEGRVLQALGRKNTKNQSLGAAGRMGAWAVQKRKVTFEKIHNLSGYIWHLGGDQGWFKYCLGVTILKSRGDLYGWAGTVWERKGILDIQLPSTRGPSRHGPAYLPACLLSPQQSPSTHKRPTWISVIRIVIIHPSKTISPKLNFPPLNKPSVQLPYSSWKWFYTQSHRMTFILVGLHILFPVRNPTWKEVCRKKRPEKCRFKDKTTHNSKHEPGSWCCWTAWGLSLWLKGHMLRHHNQLSNLQKPHQFPKRHRDIFTEIQNFLGIKTTCRRPGSTPTTSSPFHDEERWRHGRAEEPCDHSCQHQASQGRVLPQPDGHRPRAQEPDTPSGEVITCEFP